jgi:hypothetical protein
MKSHADYKIATLQSGKSLGKLFKNDKNEWDGNAHDCSAPQKICSLNLLSFLIDSMCWKMLERLFTLPRTGYTKE